MQHLLNIFYRLFLIFPFPFSYPHAIRFFSFVFWTGFAKNNRKMNGERILSSQNSSCRAEQPKAMRFQGAQTLKCGYTLSLTKTSLFPFLSLSLSIQLLLLRLIRSVRLPLERKGGGASDRAHLPSHLFPLFLTEEEGKKLGFRLLFLLFLLLYPSRHAPLTFEKVERGEKKKDEEGEEEKAFFLPTFFFGNPRL